MRKTLATTNQRCSPESLWPYASGDWPSAAHICGLCSVVHRHCYMDQRGEVRPCYTEPDGFLYLLWCHQAMNDNEMYDSEKETSVLWYYSEDCYCAVTTFHSLFNEELLKHTTQKIQYVTWLTSSEQGELSPPGLWGTPEPSWCAAQTQPWTPWSLDMEPEAESTETAQWLNTIPQ